VERVSAAGRRENAAARRTHRRTDGVDGGVGALEHARSGADSGGRRRAWRGDQRRRCQSAGRETRGAGAWQPHGDGAPTGRPGAGNGG
jgi:hypothetical protein